MQSLLFVLLLLHLSTAFVIVIAPPIRPAALKASAENDDEQPDLFEYFDPLLSPHAYPDGIAPDKKPSAADAPYDEKKVIFEEAPTASEVPPPSDFVSLLSSVRHAEQQQVEDAPPAQQQQAAADFFDPRISPHDYPHGTPDTFVGEEGSAPQKRRKLGILLMDHGSRNQASNDALHELAALYQETVDSSSRNIVVKAAHMEIASPSIEEGMQLLVKDEEVDELVLHPYFLSKNGRHVSQDIPHIVDAAIGNLEIDIPVFTTEPVGSQTDVMIHAIQSLVEQQSTILGGGR